jgi:hypothetical protein
VARKVKQAGAIRYTFTAKSRHSRRYCMSPPSSLCQPTLFLTPNTISCASTPPLPQMQSGGFLSRCCPLSAALPPPLPLHAALPLPPYPLVGAALSLSSQLPPPSSPRVTAAASPSCRSPHSSLSMPRRHPCPCLFMPCCHRSPTLST